MSIDIINSDEWRLLFKAKDDGCQIVYAFETVRRLKSKFDDIKDNEFFREIFFDSLNGIGVYGDRAILSFKSGGIIIFICDVFDCDGLHPDIVYFDEESKFYPEKFFTLLSIEKNKDWQSQKGNMNGV